MDVTKAEKLQAMRSYKKSHLLKSLILHSTTALICTVLCSYLFPLPSSSFKHLIFSSLPKFNKVSSFLGPKCSFVLGNAIVIFLIGESKLLSSKSHSPVMEIYEEYNERSHCMHEIWTLARKKEAEKMEKIGDEYMVKGKKKVEVKREEEKERKAKEEEEGQGIGLAEEELNKRIEDFIARVNRQRWLEARLINYGRG